jgi:Mg-chelatase subunit ChlD
VLISYVPLSGIEQNLDLAILLDASGSVAFTDPKGFHRMKEFVMNIMNKSEVFSDTTRIALVTFGDDAAIRCHLNTHVADLQDLQLALALTKHVPGQGSNLAGALRLLYTEVFTQQNGDRMQVPNVAIVLTDDRSTVNAELVPVNALLAAESGIRVAAVGITSALPGAELRSIASADELVFRAINFDALPGLSSRVLEAITQSLPTPAGEQNVVDFGTGSSFILFEQFSGV